MLITTRNKLVTNVAKDINIKSQLKEFCGPGKRISQAVIENIDLELQQAKEANNTYLKKTIKRRYLDVYKSC